MAAAIISYIAVSLLGPKTVFNMDQMLHRGKYAIETDTIKATDEELPKWKKRLAITKEFTKGDIFIYLVVVCQTVFWCIVGWIVLALYFLAPKLGFAFGNKQWFIFWKFWICYLIVLSVIAAIWFFIGGSIDLKNMFKMLGKDRRNNLDDGWVEGHHSKTDEETLKKLKDELE